MFKQTVVFAMTFPTIFTPTLFWKASYFLLIFEIPFFLTQKGRKPHLKQKKKLKSGLVFLLVWSFFSGIKEKLD